MKIICGRAGTGKSYFCMQEIKEAILKDAGRTYIYVVPEQYSLSAEFELANMANQNGTINIQVLSFKRLAYRVFNELGIAKPTFSNASKNMLIYYIMLKENKNLKILKGVDKNRGLANTVANMISEFKRYNVTVDTLKNANIKDEYLKNKIDDLALIYEKFEEKISKDYIETDSNLTVLAKLIDRSNMLDNAKIWIDGFDGFTPQELCIISALNKKADVTVTLCQDSGELFAINQKVLDKLRMFGDVNEVKFENQYRLKNAELMHLEKSMFKYPLKKFNDDVKNIHISLEASPYDEVESVAKIITKKVRTENLRFENIGIITKNIDTYKTAFNKVFSLYDIPYFFDDKKELANQPLLTMVLSLFDILSKGFRYEDVFNYLKSGFSNIDDVNDVDILENYVLANGIRGNR